MIRMIVAASLLILPAAGSGCAVSTPDSPAPQFQSSSGPALRKMLEDARGELLRDEEELARTEKEIRNLQGKDGPVLGRLMEKRGVLKAKILQSKINARELEILLNEER
jgi:hypothetical protein